jgi:origin recognition complex subunit 6
LLTIMLHRLKQSLNLPKIEPRPPCPPRIYNKLYTYLDGLLVQVARKRGRPPGSTSTKSTPTKSLPSRPSPTKATSLAAYKTTPGRAASSRRRGLQFADTTTEIPPWIHPTIRALCKEFKTPAAAPHILAGVTTILTLPSPKSTEDQRGESASDKKDKLPALIAAVNFFVGTRLRGRETTGSEYTSQRKAILQALAALKDDAELEAKIKASGNSANAWSGWETVEKKDIDAWLLEISSRGWLKLDWFENISEGSGLDIGPDDLEVDENDASQSDDEVTEGTRTLRTGLGTMMQDRVDYLSDKKRAEYRIWKEGIMARIEEIELGQTEESMDTADG